MMTYLNENNYIDHSHHGSVTGKSTQTLVQEIYDILLTSLENKETSAYIQLDQSKAYNVVCHSLLLQKIEALGFNQKTMNIFRSYLNQRKQQVVVDSFQSDILLVGPRSITQGSTLSCILYLIFILDITQIYHKKKYDIQEYSECSNRETEENIGCDQTNAKTYVDNKVIITKPKNDQSIQQAVINTISRIEDYTNANRLALNPDGKLKQNFSVTVGRKEIRHEKKLVILGNVLTEDLSWDRHVSQMVIPSLSNRARSLKILTQCMSQDFKQKYATAVFMGKLNFEIDAWSGESLVLIKKRSKKYKTV